MFTTTAQKVSFALGVVWMIPWMLYFTVALFGGEVKHIAIAGFWMLIPTAAFWWLTGVLWPVVDKFRGKS